MVVPQGLGILSAWFIPILYGALGALPSILILFADLDRSTDIVKSATLNRARSRDNVYDFIVVGAGSAGCVVANRLSENFNVLLLERGGEPNPVSLIPGLATILLNRPQTDYMYRTVPQQSSCLSLNNRQSSWSRGRGLGGSSNLNLMIYLRGHPRDYDNWANVTGDARWSYRNLLPFFMRSENYCFACETPPRDVLAQPFFHRSGGPLSISRPSYNPLVDEFLKASAWNGIPRVDLNGPYKEGAAGITYTQKRGLRHSTYHAFIKPILGRRTLTVMKYSRVYRILMRGENNEAYGVEYLHHGKPRVAFATKEVIISAGAIDSPKLLMLSGIGPRAHLESLGINVRIDAPVGQNLQDHIGTFPGPFIVNEPRSFILERDVNLKQVKSFVALGNGTLTQTGINAVAFFTSPFAKARGEGDWPDTQWMFVGVGNYNNLARDYSKAFNVRFDILNKFLEPVRGKDAFQITVMLSRPNVRGQLLLASANFYDDPIIDPRYFEDMNQEDIRVMVEGVKRAVYVAENAPSFREIGSRLSPVPFPPCAHLLFRSDPYWECFTRHYSVSIFHYSGTTRMGPRFDPRSVVDPELRVIGAKRLRVIDAGVMPFVVTVNTNGAAIVIGERGAEFVLETWSPYLRRAGGGPGPIKQGIVKVVKGK